MFHERLGDFLSGGGSERCEGDAGHIWGAWADVPTAIIGRVCARRTSHMFLGDASVIASVSPSGIEVKTLRAESFVAPRFARHRIGRLGHHPVCDEQCEGFGVALVGDVVALKIDRDLGDFDLVL